MRRFGGCHASLLSIYDSLSIIDNMKNTDNKLGLLVATTLESRLPEGWAVNRRSPENSTLQLYEVATPSGETGTILARSASQVEPREVERYAQKLREEATSMDGSPELLLVAPFLSRRARERLVIEGVSYLDRTGNTRLSMRSPAVFIETTGSDRSPGSAVGYERKSARTLRGGKSARIVRALCDGVLALPLGVKELSEYTEVDAGQVSRVLDLLDREGVIERGKRGAVTEVDVPALIRRWADDYSVLDTNKVATFYDPDTAMGSGALLDRLAENADAVGRCAVSGALAAERLAPYAPSAVATIYTDAPYALAEALDLEETDDRPNVFLVAPFDEVVFVGTETVDGVTYAAPPQVAVDSLGGLGREPAAGEELLRVMGGRLRDAGTSVRK